MLSTRSLSAIGLFLAIASMVFAVGYLQMIEYLAPCNLCILDRAVIIGLGFVFLIAWLHNPARTGRKTYATLAALLSLTGIGICVRHIQLQNMPASEAPQCLGGFQHMWYNMPFPQFLDTIFNSPGSCSDIQWQFLGFSIPEWTLALFVIFLGLALMLFFSQSGRALTR